MEEFQRNRPWGEDEFESREDYQDRINALSIAAADLYYDYTRGREFSPDNLRSSLELMAAVSDNEIANIARRFVKDRGETHEAYGKIFADLGVIRAKAGEYLKLHPVDKAPIEAEFARLYEGFELINRAVQKGEEDVEYPTMLKIAMLGDDVLTDLARWVTGRRLPVTDAAAEPVFTPEVGAVGYQPRERVVNTDKEYMRTYELFFRLRNLARLMLQVEGPKENLD